MFAPDKQFVAGASRSEDAFAALVRQHINLVFATALRQVGDRGAAEEITQNVFIALARASGKLKSHPTLAGWLYRTTLNKSREWLRSELRRHRHEEIAVARELAAAEGDSVWSPLVPLLDEALLRLREPDRLAVVMHFMEGQTFEEVGSALGVGKDTARKRVDRCLDELTYFFRRRGFAIPALTAGAPLFALSSHTAPTGLAASATSAGLAAAHSAASTSTLAIIKGTLNFMAWTNAKTAIVVGIGLLVAAGTTTVAVKSTEEFRTPAWQKAYDYDLSYLDRLPPQVKILPSLPSTAHSGLHISGNRNGKTVGLGQSLPDLVMMAYGVRPAQLIWRVPVNGGKYDFIANLPTGNARATQREITKKFGLTVRYETMTTNALILTVKYPNAPGFRPAGKDFAGNSGMNHYSAHNQSIWGLVNYLEGYLGPVIDRTQLTNNYNIDFNWDGRTREGLKQALLDQVGLELVPTNQPVRMLLVEKAK